MKIEALFLAIVLGAGGWARAADLLETFHAAQSNDPVFAAARAQQQAEQEKLPQGRSLLLPSVSVSANSTYNDQSTQFIGTFPFPNTSNRYNSYGYGMNLVQPLYRQQNWVTYSESKLEVIQSQLKLKAAEQDLILRVAQAYFDVLNAQNSVEVVAAQKAAISEQLEQAKKDFDVGTATVTDTLEAQARYDLTAAQQIVALNDLDIKLNILQQLINMRPQNLKPLGKELKLESPQPADMEKWVDSAELNNLQVAISQADEEIAEKEVARNRGGHYPTLDLVANYATNNAANSMYGVGIDNTLKTIGVQLNIPIYEGGAVDSKWREAEANHERARQQLENVRRSVAEQTRQAYLGVVSGIAQVNALKQALASSESMLEASKLGHAVGVRTNLDVLNAQQQLYSTRRDLYQAQYNYLLSELRLEAAGGTLSEDDLRRENLALE